MLRILLSSFLVMMCLGSSDIILKPNSTHTSGSPVGLIWCQGAQIPTDRYIPVAQALQQKFGRPLYISIPAFALDTPEPAVMDSTLSGALTKLHSAGLPTTAPMFYAGHSLGGAMLQTWSKDKSSKMVGQILMGSFITRSNRENVSGNAAGYAVPTMTIGGEKDGLARVTRIAEAFRMQRNWTSDPMINYPTIVILGLSHMQFASGEPPLLVHESDLRPEISYSVAHELISKYMSAFMSVRINNDPTGNNRQTIISAVESTKKFVGPIIHAFELEGFYHFKQPCYCTPLICPQHSDECAGGSPWTALFSQKMMAGFQTAPSPFNKVGVATTDSFHRVYSINPVHLPNVWNNCTMEQVEQGRCILNMTTVTQNVYDDLDPLDTGYDPISATEMRVKMSSRQISWIRAGYKNANFTELDGQNICQTINQFSYNFALQTAGKTTINRFKSLGEPLVIGPDLGPYNVGPEWIWDGLNYNKIKDSTGKETHVEIRSPMMRTPANYWISASCCFHYCKILSPARAIEWIYVDGLQLHDSLNTTY